MEIHTALQNFCDYSRYIRGYAPKTIQRYRYAITYYARITTVTHLADITDDNVRALFFYGRTERHWQPATYLVFYKSLKVFFRWCQKEGYLLTNPIDGIEKPKLENKLPAKLTKQDAFRLLEIVANYPYDNRFHRYRNHAMFATFIFAGLRLNELLKLRYGDVDVVNATLFVNQGKGNKDRIIPVSVALLPILHKYLEERQKAKKTCPEFFTSYTRNCAFTESGMKRLVLNIRNASGLQFSIHKLRHTFATLMLEAGCDIYSLSKMMGHSDIKTTTIYLGASAEHLRSQMNKHPLNDIVRI